jgi:hypothetical protein
MKQPNTSRLPSIIERNIVSIRYDVLDRICRHFEEFFCSHAPLIENHFQKIMNAAETNMNERNAIAAALLDVNN